MLEPGDSTSSDKNVGNGHVALRGSFAITHQLDLMVHPSFIADRALRAIFHI